MPKASFEDFLEENKNYNKVFENKETRFIFDHILSNDYNIIAMIYASDMGLPALDVCLREIESYYEKSLTKEFNLADKFTKQGLGKLCKSVLAPFGYVPSGRNGRVHSEYIDTSMIYKKEGNPSMKVEVRIVENDDAFNQKEELSFNSFTNI